MLESTSLALVTLKKFGFRNGAGCAFHVGPIKTRDAVYDELGRPEAVNCTLLTREPKTVQISRRLNLQERKLVMRWEREIHASPVEAFAVC
jgi:hypothetical protein